MGIFQVHFTLLNHLSVAPSLYGRPSPDSPMVWHWAMTIYICPVFPDGDDPTLLVNIFGLRFCVITLEKAKSLKRESTFCTEDKVINVWSCVKVKENDISAHAFLFCDVSVCPHTETALVPIFSGGGCPKSSKIDFCFQLSICTVYQFLFRH